MKERTGKKNALEKKNFLNSNKFLKIIFNLSNSKHILTYQTANSVRTVQKVYSSAFVRVDIYLD